jgi:DNA mismatch endonuclease (patch repair protein)
MAASRSRQRRPARPELVTDAETSARLGRIRQSDTKPELVVRQILHALGARFRTHARDLPGSPDISNRARHWAIFVHGCFWHRHTDCLKATTPKRNAEFWRAKFDANVARDARAVADLRARGYRVLTVWECETRELAKLRARLETFINRREATGITKPDPPIAD